jgi:hypothetical protein
VVDDARGADQEVQGKDPLMTFMSQSLSEQHHPGAGRGYLEVRATGGTEWGEGLAPCRRGWVSPHTRNAATVSA